MNQTTTPPPPPPGGPHASGAGPDAERLRSVTSTRRSTDSRLVAGVASGIGRQLGIDPIIVRIVLVALCFAGLSGLILYATAWFVLPSDDGRPSVMADWFRLGDTEPQARVVVMVLGAVFALVAVVGDTGWFWGFGAPVGALWLAVPALFFYWLFAVRPRRGRTADPAPWPTAGPPTSPPPTSPPPSGPPAGFDAPAPGPDPSSTDLEPADHDAQNDQNDQDVQDDEVTYVLSEPDASDDGPRGGDPVPPPAPVAHGGPPPRPHVPRTPPTLFLATMSVVLIALGGIATVDAGTDLDLAPQVYPAVALGIVGLGLLVGARWGRSIALVPVGLVLAAILGAIGLVPDGPLGDLRRTPTTAAAVDAEYELGAGSLRLDLSGVRDPEELLGRTIVIDGGLGQVRVILPADLDVTVEARISGGEIRVLGERTSGQGASLDVVSDERPALTLEIDHTFGQIDVERA